MPGFQLNGIESQLLKSINDALQNQNGAFLQSILIIEPPYPPIYQELIVSLQTNYPLHSASSESQLESLIRSNIPEVGESEDDQGRPVPGWGNMVTFLSAWLAFIRDVNVENLLETYERLSDLQSKANSALQHTVKGVLVLPTVVAYAKVLSRVAIGLDRRPDLIAQSKLLSGVVASDEGQRESLPEKAANLIRNAFITCLNDRNTAPGGVNRETGKPDGKKVGIYSLANICLKILFKAHQLESCQTLFNNIQNSSPPLSIYPASHRVTYLYHLGRYHFAMTDYYAAQLVLQKAYDDCPHVQECIGQRRILIIYLIACNMLLGRLPTQAVYARPEAKGLREYFEPLAQSIRKGDLETFRRITKLDLSHPHASWFCRYGIFYPLGTYCEIYVWRSIFRKVFLLTGKVGETAQSAPTLDLHAVLAAFLYYEKRALLSESMAQADAGPGQRHISLIFSESTPALSSGYVDPDFEGLGLKPYFHMPDLMEVEAMCGSLIMQGFLNGYMSFTAKKFAIMGAKKGGGPLKAGFPNIWETIKKKSSDDVRGWKKEGSVSQGMGGVVRLAGARPAGF